MMPNVIKPKILIIGGPDVNSRIDLAKKMNDHIEFVFAGSSKKIKKDFMKNKFDYFHYHLNPGMSVLSDLFSFFSLIKIIKRVSPDIAHTYDTKPGIIGRMAAKFCRISIIIGTQPGLGMVFSKSNPLFGDFGKYFYEKLYKFICQNSTITVFQNNHDLSLMIKKKIINDKKAKLIKSSGVDTNFFSYNRKLHKIPIIESKKKINVVFISRIIKSKGIIDFCEIAKSVKKDFPQIIFNHVGEHQHESLDSVSESELSYFKDYVNFLGRFNNIKNILIDSDIMIFPSYYPEGVPRALMEAASMGLPLIGYENAGSNEIIKSGINGFLVNPGDKDSLIKEIIKILKEEKLYVKFSKNSRKIAVKEFDINIIAKQYLKLYHLCLAN